MTLINKVSKYFDVRELVPKEVFDKYGQNSWQFLCPMLLETILIIREGLNRPITVNNWHLGGVFDERGLRVNILPVVKDKTIKGVMYLTAHLMGKAVDFDVKGMSAEQVRNWIIENKELFPYKIRLEHKFSKTGKPITWVHLDVYQNDKNPKIYLFNV